MTRKCIEGNKPIKIKKRGKLRFYSLGHFSVDKDDSDYGNYYADEREGVEGRQLSDRGLQRVDTGLEAIGSDLKLLGCRCE